MFGFKDNSSNKNKPLKIIVVGSGKVGTALIEQLVREGNDITLIDKDATKVSEVSAMYDIMGIVGNGASYSVQKEAGIFDTDLLIAVTESDELNLLCCTVAKQVGDCAGIARVRTPDYSNEVNYLRDRLGLAMIINPELEAAREIAHILYLPSALEVNSFAHGEAEIIRFKVEKDSPIVGLTISEYIEHSPSKMLFCAAERNGDVIIPNGSFRFKVGDIIAFVTPLRGGRSCLRHLGIKSEGVSDCMIVGGGKASYYLARKLVKNGINVKIIEKDKQRCEQLSESIPEAIIINGDGTDEDLLKEEGLESCESFIPLTGLDEENIILTLHAKQVSNAKVVTKINRFTFKNVISSLDLGSVVYPRYITAEAIIAYARAKRASLDSNIETLTHIYDQRVECIEFHIDRPSDLTGTKIMDLKIKEDLMISFINRNGNIIFPRGGDTIEVGDTVMIVTTHTGFNDITDILA